MGYINLADKTINAKLVYYGTGLGGKTTSLQAIHEILCPRNEVKLVSINTDEDATLLFDFLPINLGQVEGFKIRIQGYTVPGQPKYRLMRKFVLSGADAVVFVIDSQKNRDEENRQALEDLQVNLRANGLDPETMPIILQYNKRDLPEVTDLEELERTFKFRDIPTFPTIATERKGVFEAFCKTTELLVKAKIKQYGLGKGKVDPEEVAKGATARLCQIKESHETNLVEDSNTFDKVTLTVTEEDADRLEEESNDLRATALCSLKPGKDELAPVVDGEETPADKPPEVLTGPAPEMVEEQEPAQEFEEVEELEELEELECYWEEPEEELEELEPFFEEVATAEPVSDSAVGPTLEGENEENSERLLGQVVQSNVELAALYAELDEYKNLLERKNNEMVEISQIISHDLKKPLTALKTVISLLRKGYLGELSEQQKDAIQNAFEASNYMEDLIGDILDSTRLDHDCMELELEEVDMTLLVGEIIRRLKYHLTETNVSIRVEPLPTIKCDSAAMTKVFTNLMGNAINYRDPTRGPYLHISADEVVDGMVTFRVEDNGIGIPETDHETVFKKFKRGNNTGGINGTGLGLYIVREIVRRHGGDVTFETAKDKGTTFTLSLKVNPPARVELAKSCEKGQD